MNYSHIKDLVSGERLLHVQPTPETSSAEDWRRRLNHYTGRTLTHSALQREQLWHNGHLASLGQLVSPGVISGLQVSPNADSTNETSASEIHISAGSALTSNGELIRIVRPVSVELNKIFVFDHATHGERNAQGNPENLPYAEDLSSLQQFTKDNVSGLKAGILVLEPLAAEINVEVGPDDPCEIDPSDLAFENWQLFDACRLVIYTWPEEWVPLPAKGTGWRNRVAHSIFSKESELKLGEYHPWERGFVPISLILFDDAHKAEIIDRSSVVRQGGKRRDTRSALRTMGDRFLWQAQFEQFNEHLAEMIFSTSEHKQAISKVDSELRYIPPVGILPKPFINLKDFQQEFFPTNYEVEILAIPFEQADIIVRESASLLPYDLEAADTVQILVPLPQAEFDPDILTTATVDTEFDQSIRDFTHKRNTSVGTRLNVRRKASALYKSLKGKTLDFPHPDPDAIDNFEIAFPYETQIIKTGEDWKFFKGIKISPPADWTLTGFDDGNNSWHTGPTPIGYGDPEPDTLISDMQGNYISLFFRKTFIVSKAMLEGGFNLKIITNGGFAVHVNGNLVETHNLSSQEFNATAIQPENLTSFNINAKDFKDKLVEGDNVLAIQVHNDDLDSRSLSFSTTLVSKIFIPDEKENGFGVEYQKVANDDPDSPPKAVMDENGDPIYQVTLINNLKTYLKNRTKLPDSDLDSLDKSGLERFIVDLERKISSTDDKINLGFVRIQTDIYRMRQFMLGNVEGTKLATSPILASIARGETAQATKKEIADFVLAAKQNIVPPIFKATRTEEPPSGTGTDESTGDPATSPTRFSRTFTRAGSLPEATTFKPVESPSPLILSTRPPSSIPALTLKTKRFEGIKSPSQPESALFKSQTTTKDILGQQHIIGGAVDFKNTTIVERLEEPIATSAKSSGIATKADILSSFQDSELFIADIQVPGFRVKDEAGKEKEESFSFGKVFERVDGKTKIDEILKGDHDKNNFGDGQEQLQDEAAFYSSGVRALENSTTVLRRIEGRVHSYHLALDRCKSTLTEIQTILGKADSRLKQIEDQLAEARHDVSVSRALKNEEMARIDAINEKRIQIIDEHVPYFLFRRPRLIDKQVKNPVHFLNPDLTDEGPLPECDFDEAATPSEIGAMIEVIREAPLKWFTSAKSILGGLNRIQDLRVTLMGAHHRSKVKTINHPSLKPPANTIGRFQQGIGNTLFANYNMVTNKRKAISTLNATRVNWWGWKETADHSKEILSLGDIIDGKHGRMGASRKAAKELEQIEAVASCIYRRFGEILPTIRLDWAERLSQFDAPINLINLYNLPRWGEVDFQDRMQIQKLVSWLYKRVSTSFSEAENMISDLVRICILLASHAPVKKIISGHIEEPVTIQKDTLVKIVADLTRIRVGMHVNWQQGTNTVAWGKVEDIADGLVAARVINSHSKSINLESKAKVLIGEPQVFSANNFTFANF